MAISREVRRLGARWNTGTGWPKRLEWIEIENVRGWTGQRFALQFPIMAIVGENGTGKSTVLQCAASVYESTPPAYRRGFASDFFPETAWDTLRRVVIGYSLREGDTPHMGTIRKPGPRWRGNPERRDRNIEYIDLSRIQPVAGRVGYLKLARPDNSETSATPFDEARLDRLSGIMGRTYDLAKMALTTLDPTREITVLNKQGATYSGFHQGAGETTITELLERDLPRYSLVLIDEIESSLHPRAQRRLIRDLAERCRERELQVILTTHSPYVLEELPPEARAYILQPEAGGREIVYGVSPDFALTKMDDIQHAECDLYVEDRVAERMLIEILVASDLDLVQRCQTIPYGAASVGQSLGQMVVGNRFPRPSCVFLDGDQGTSPGCLTLPGDDAPELVVFGELRSQNWLQVHVRTGRSFAQVADACSQAMNLPDHHSWIDYAASRLTLGGDTLWQAMCAEWATQCLDATVAESIVRPINDVLIGVPAYQAVLPIPAPISSTASPEQPTEPPTSQEETSPTGQPQLFEQ
jgi:predicted ATPase